MWGYPLTLSVNINDSMNVKKGKRKRNKEMRVFDRTTLVCKWSTGTEKLYAGGVCVARVHGCSSESKGAEEKTLRGEEYVPVGCS